jgi:hypothetical protein
MKVEVYEGVPPVLKLEQLRPGQSAHVTGLPHKR